MKTLLVLGLALAFGLTQAVASLTYSSIYFNRRSAAESSPFTDDDNQYGDAPLVTGLQHYSTDALVTGPGANQALATGDYYTEYLPTSLSVGQVQAGVINTQSGFTEAFTTTFLQAVFTVSQSTQATFTLESTIGGQLTGSLYGSITTLQLLRGGTEVISFSHNSLGFHSDTEDYTLLPGYTYTLWIATSSRATSGTGVNESTLTATASMNAVPEPSTYALLTLGSAALLYARLRRRA